MAAVSSQLCASSALRATSSAKPISVRRATTCGFMHRGVWWVWVSWIGVGDGLGWMWCRRCVVVS